MSRIWIITGAWLIIMVGVAGPRSASTTASRTLPAMNRTV